MIWIHTFVPITYDSPLLSLSLLLYIPIYVYIYNIIVIFIYLRNVEEKEEQGFAIDGLEK